MFLYILILIVWLRFVNHLLNYCLLTYLLNAVQYIAVLHNNTQYRLELLIVYIVL